VIGCIIIINKKKINFILFLLKIQKKRKLINNF